VASLFLAKTTYSVILSILTGVFALAYPLRPIHLSILSWFTIGVPRSSSPSSPTISVSAAASSGGSWARPFLRVS